MIACDYMTAKFPFHDPVLLNAEVANVATREQQVFQKLLFFVKCYPCLLQQSASVDVLEQQFNSYQVAQLPNTKSMQIDEAWHVIGNIKDVATGKLKFDVLSKVMKGILVIFHSNADCERIFSLVNKNKTEFRANLSTNTLGSLLTRKTVMSARSQVCHTLHHSDELLKRAKSATYTHHTGDSTKA